MNTATTILNAIDLSTNISQADGALGVDLNSLTVNDIVLEATIVNKDSTGANTTIGYNTSLDIYFAFASSQQTSTIPDILGGGAQIFRVQLPHTTGGTKITTSEVVTKKGRWIHVWVAHDTLSGVKLTLKIIS